MLTLLPALPAPPSSPRSQLIGDLVGGQSLWSVLAIFCGLVLVGTTFISHTVGAMVILPIVQAVGDHMPGNHSKLLVMGAALMCSGERAREGDGCLACGGVCLCLVGWWADGWRVQTTGDGAMWQWCSSWRAACALICLWLR